MFKRPELLTYSRLLKLTGEELQARYLKPDHLHQAYHTLEMPKKWGIAVLAADPEEGLPPALIVECQDARATRGEAHLVQTPRGLEAMCDCPWAERGWVQLSRRPAPCGHIATVLVAAQLLARKSLPETGGLEPPLPAKVLNFLKPFFRAFDQRIAVHYISADERAASLPEGTPKLTGIVFRVGERMLDGAESLPSFTRPDPKEFEKHPVVLQEWSDPMAGVGSYGYREAIPVDSGILRAEALEAIQRVQYCFDNGLRLSGKEICRHAAALAISDALLPFSSPEEAEAGGSVHAPMLLPGMEPHSLAGVRAVGRIFVRILKAALTEGISVWVAPPAEERGVRIRDVWMPKQNGSAWPLAPLLRFVPAEDGGIGIDRRPSPGLDVQNTYVIDPTAGRVLLYPVHRMRNELVPQWNRMKIGVEPFEGLTWFEMIRRSIESFERSVGCQGAVQIERDPAGSIRGVTPRLEIDLQKNLRFSASVTMSDGFAFPYSTPLDVHSIVARGLATGLGDAFQEERGRVARQTRGHGRDRDLKVLRHAGFFGVLFETAMAQRAWDDFEAAVLPWMKRIFADDVGLQALMKPGKKERIGHYLGDRVVSLIRELFDQVREAERSLATVFGPRGTVDLPRFAALGLEFWLAALRVSRASKSGCLPDRTRVSLFAGLERALELPVVEGVDWISGMAVELLPRGYRLLLNGQDVEALAEEDITAETKLLGQTDDQSLDWFELEPRVFLRGKEITQAELSSIARGGLVMHRGRMYLVPQAGKSRARKLEEFWERIARSPRSKPSSFGDTGYEAPPARRHEILEMLALRSRGMRVIGNARWRQIEAFYDSLSSARDADEVPSGFKGELRSFQRTGYQWLLDLHRLGLGGILADDMGLGKTVQVIAFLENLRERNYLGRTLVIVPTSLIHNWRSEVARFAPALPLEVFSKEMKSREEVPPGILLTTYGLLVEHAEWFKECRWDNVIWDEAQALKSAGSLRAKVSREIQAGFQVALSGTPFENHYGELFSLMETVLPGALGQAAEFRERYQGKEPPSAEDVEFLRLKMKPILLRRTKSEILLDLPERTESLIELPFEKKQAAIYRDIALAWNEKVRGEVLRVGEVRSQIHMFTALTRLRQVCSDPASIPDVRYTGVPPKLEALLASLQGVVDSGHSALVFTQFIPVLEKVEKALKELSIPVWSICGAVSGSERERRLREFQECQSGGVLVMTLKTGGVGLNLTRASFVYHLDPWWNPAVENQATDRAHRMGQRRAVQVYRMRMKESVEEKIDLLKARKKAAFDALLGGAESDETGTPGTAGGSFLSRSDFELLLGVSP